MGLSRQFFWLSILGLLCSFSAAAQQGSEQSFLLNNTRIQTAIEQTKDKKYQAPSDFYLLLQKNLDAINDSTIPIVLRISFQQRLANFIENAKDPDLFRNGKYSSLLRYNQFLIKWKTNGTLFENSIQYPLLSIRALRLFASDSAAYRLIDSLSILYPDEILRNSESFISLWYAPKIISKIAKVAPESVKRYFLGSIQFQELLRTDTSEIVKNLRIVFNKLPMRTRAYLLIDQIVKKELTLNSADSIGYNRDVLFTAMLEIMKRQQPLGLYSINKELDFTCVDIARGLALKSDAAVVNYYQISEYSKEAIVAVLIYGYKEMYSIDFSNMLSILSRKGSYPIPSPFFENFPKQKVAEFVRYLLQNEKLEKFIQIAGAQNENYLKSLFTYENVKDDLTPDLIRPLNIPLIETQKPKRNTESVHTIQGDQVDLALAKINEKITVTPKVSEIKPSVEPEEEFVEPIHFDLSEEQKLKLVYKKNIFAALQNIDAFINEPYAKEILMYAAETEPDEVFKRVEKFKAKYFLQEVLEKAALQSPVSAKKYLVNPYHLVSFFLSKSENPYIKKMIEINTSTGFKSKPYLFINQITKGEMSVEKAISVCNNQELLFKELVALVESKDYIGTISIEREFAYYALRFIRGINDKVSQPDNIRFASLDNLSQTELYFATVYGREEVFNSTFSGIFSRFENGLKQINDISFNHFLKLPKLNTFIALCASNYKLSRLLSFFSAPQREKLLHHFVSDLVQNSNSFDDAVMVSETIANTNNEDILLSLERYIKEQYAVYDSIKDSKGMAIYGILAGLCKDKAVYDKRWFNLMSKKYQASELTTLQFKAMDVDDKIVERMYFYDDPDGQTSYQSFLNSFRNAGNWKVEEYYSYIKVSSLNGKAIEIYANKPSYEESGEQNINKTFTDFGYKPTVIIHRGHSFHTEKTLEKIPATAKLVFIGSCGGFYKASIAIKNAPDAHIIATRQIGTQQINDPVIFSINEAFRQRSDIQWPVFWEKLKQQLGNYSLFYDYVPPHKNIESLFQRAYFKTLGM